MNKRVIPTCSPEHECSDEEIMALGDEIDAIAKDENVIHYELPDVETMKQIIATAENYTGEWYHSEVTVSDQVSVSEEHDALRDRIIELGASHGIYLLYIFSFESEGTALDDKAKESLAKAFGSDSIKEFRELLVNDKKVQETHQAIRDTPEKFTSASDLP